jgi:hypothetical protein
MEQRADPNPLTIVDRGGGTYTATLPDSPLPGKYTFSTTLAFKHPTTNENIKRVRSIEAAVEVKVDPNASDITVTRVDGPLYHVVVVPRDKFGNYVGPGYGSGVSVKLTGGGTVAGPPQDAGDQGNYTTSINVPAGVDPRVTIAVNGYQLADAPLSVILRGKRRCCLATMTASAWHTNGTRMAFAFALIGLLVVYRRRR